MARPKGSVPAGHGELLLQPEYAEWKGLLERNREAALGWSFEIAGLPANELRRRARSEALDHAQSFSARLRVPLERPAGADAPVVMTGHQPQLYHPGVWMKDFLLHRLAKEIRATAMDVVVDSDGFDVVELVSPCLTPQVHRCRQPLAVASEESCFACTPPPSAHDVDAFCRAGEAQLASLPDPSIRLNFARFAEALRSAEADAASLSELMTFARRRYEASGGTGYLELPVTSVCRTAAFARFVVDIALNAERFVDAYNSELASYRALTKTRSKAQPFPDLATTGEGALEIPFWALHDGRRETVWVRRTERGIELLVGREDAIALPVGPDAAEAALTGSPVLVVPKAVALTLFTRLFCSDLFIHGVGGGRYDAVTDGVCRRYYGVEPPAFVVATLTMHLPLSLPVVTEDEVSAARERLNRLEHNPDQILAEVEFETEGERARAQELAAEKERLVRAISEPGADRKALGLQIREVNASLAGLLDPLRASWREELARLESAAAASEVLLDRTYPFCLWSPSEIAEKVE